MHMVVLRVAVDGAALQDGKTQYFYCPIWDDDLETPLESKIDEVRWLLFCECRNENRMLPADSHVLRV